ISLCSIVRSSYEWPSASIPPPVRVRADVAGPHAAADARGGSGQPFDEERLVEQMRAWANARSVDRTAKDRRPEVAPSTHAPLVPGPIEGHQENRRMTNTPITCRNFYAGTWHDGSGGVIDRANPATGELAAVAPRSTADDVDAAVKSAVEAFRTWRKTRPAERAKYLHQLADECAQRVDDMASAITREQGKPLNEARGEVQKFVTALHYYAEEATRVFGRTIPND